MLFCEYKDKRYKREAHMTMAGRRYEPADIRKAYVRDSFWDRCTGRVFQDSERFTTDYDLPNHSAYAESCACGCGTETERGEQV